MTEIIYSDPYLRPDPKLGTTPLLRTKPISDLVFSAARIDIPTAVGPRCPPDTEIAHGFP
jgi:hypothetical protein